MARATAGFGLALAGAMALATMPGAAAEPPDFTEVVHLSCAEVAEQAGDDENHIVAIITVLAAFSLEQRGLVVPEDRADLGLQFGELIKAFCTAEPEGLLYNAVHRAMLRLL